MYNCKIAVYPAVKIAIFIIYDVCLSASLALCFITTNCSGEVFLCLKRKVSWVGYAENPSLEENPFLKPKPVLLLTPLLIKKIPW
jgi:hypothetical protein